jgi:tRNA nucleotidyltransferase/poly(A) polymerase
MKNFLDKIFLRSNNLDHISNDIQKLTNNTPVNRVFDAINSFSSESEARYVGGCLRKIIKGEKVDDIDLATNLEPNKICEALKQKKITYFETGIDHGTVTAVIEKYKFEITSLREDVLTDGRHAKVKFSNSWKDDSLRRDFTINSIYADCYGNLFDPHNGKEDLENGVVHFIGNVDKRIKEDYLRILRYIRFFLDYSKKPHSAEILKRLKINIGGVSKLSKERLFDELKKIVELEKLEKLSKDKSSLELFLLIFPELKNLNIFSKLNSFKKEILNKNDFIFFLCLMIIDGTDNTDYFLYRFNMSKKNQKRIKIIDNFYREKINSTSFTEGNLNKFFYYNGIEAINDILNYRIIKSKNFDKKLLELIEFYQNKSLPTMPIDADLLMTKYKIPKGKMLGDKLKKIEEEWVNNSFKISDLKIEAIVKD